MKTEQRYTILAWGGRAREYRSACGRFRAYLERGRWYLADQRTGACKPFRSLRIAKTVAQEVVSTEEDKPRRHVTK